MQRVFMQRGTKLLSVLPEFRYDAEEHVIYTADEDAAREAVIQAAKELILSTGEAATIAAECNLEIALDALKEAENG